MGKVKIQIDELEAELSYEGWLGFKKKVLGAMLNGSVSWQEGSDMRDLIDFNLAKHSKLIQEYKMDTQHNG